MIYEHSAYPDSDCTLHVPVPIRIQLDVGHGPDVQECSPLQWGGVTGVLGRPDTGEGPQGQVAHHQPARRHTTRQQVVRTHLLFCIVVSPSPLFLSRFSIFFKIYSLHSVHKYVTWVLNKYISTRQTSLSEDICYIFTETYSDNKYRCRICAYRCMVLNRLMYHKN